MKCKIKNKKTLDQLNNPQWMPGEGYLDSMRGNYEEVMECEYVEELIGNTKCNTYYLIKEGIRSCCWDGSVFKRDWELL